jgi:hypothetical protein
MSEKGGDTMTSPLWRVWIALDSKDTWAVLVPWCATSMVVFCLAGRRGRSSRFRFFFHDINFTSVLCISSGFA